jgi:hypothetical protein
LFFIDPPWECEPQRREGRGDRETLQEAGGRSPDRSVKIS